MCDAIWTGMDIYTSISLSNAQPPDPASLLSLRISFWFQPSQPQVSWLSKQKHLYYHTNSRRVTNPKFRHLSRIPKNLKHKVSFSTREMLNLACFGYCLSLKHMHKWIHQYVTFSLSLRKIVKATQLLTWVFHTHAFFPHDYLMELRE